MGARNRIGRAATLTVLLLAAIGILVSLLNFTRSDTTNVQPQIGYIAPDFLLPTTDNRNLKLSDLRGKVVLVNFWGSWCEPCRIEMPYIEKTYAKWKDKDFVVVGVNIGESKVTAKGFVDRFGLSFPIVLDQDRNVTLQQYKIGPIPTSFFIDRKGAIRYIYTGPMNVEYIEKNIQTLLSES